MLGNIAFGCLLLMLLMSCGEPDRKQIAANIGNEVIYMKSIDSLISDRLYERLFDIYYNRNIALQQFLSQKLLKMEAVNRNISVDSLLIVEVENNLSRENLDSLIRQHNLQQEILDPANLRKPIPTNSAEGQSYLKELLRRELHRTLIDRLINKYEVESHLSPPLPPKISTSYIEKHSLNREGKIEVVIVSDFDCAFCREKYSVFKNIIEKYGDDFSFYYAHLSDSISPKILFSECLYQREGDFNSVLELMFEQPVESGTLSGDLQASFDEIAECMKANEKELVDKIQRSFDVLRAKQISRTPVLIIDGRIYYGEIDMVSLTDYLDLVIEENATVRN